MAETRGPAASPESDAEVGAAVLLVEDDEGLRPILARHLRRHGYTVTEAASAEAAVAALHAGLRPDLVVLDVNLPGATGWDLLRAPALRTAGTPPVIIASAVTVSPRRLAEHGVAGYLPKPFPLQTLLQTVQRLLEPVRPPGGSPVHE